MQDKINIKLSPSPLDRSKVDLFIYEPGSGAEVVFVGKVRNATQGKEVLGLSFEAYEPMAKREMEKIATEVIALWDIRKIAIHHRVGELSIGDIPVIIGVSSAHRKEAFKACQFAIDTLKKTVPIWKKEIFRDGEVWVGERP